MSKYLVRIFIKTTLELDEDIRLFFDNVSFSYAFKSANKSLNDGSQRVELTIVIEAQSDAKAGEAAIIKARIFNDYLSAYFNKPMILDDQIGSILIYKGGQGKSEVNCFFQHSLIEDKEINLPPESLVKDMQQGLEKGGDFLSDGNLDVLDIYKHSMVNKYVIGGFVLLASTLEGLIGSSNEKRKCHKESCNGHLLCSICGEEQKYDKTNWHICEKHGITKQEIKKILKIRGKIAHKGVLTTNEEKMASDLSSKMNSAVRSILKDKFGWSESSKINFGFTTKSYKPVSHKFHTNEINAEFPKDIPTLNDLIDYYRDSFV